MLLSAYTSKGGFFMGKHLIAIVISIAAIMSVPATAGYNHYSGTTNQKAPVIATAVAAEGDGAQTTKTVWVTAYSSTPEETDDTPFITASMTEVRDGIIAANFLPFGTKVLIPELFGDKIFVVEDRMHQRKKNFVDIWMDSKQDALNFGIARAEIVILNDL